MMHTLQTVLQNNAHIATMQTSTMQTVLQNNAHIATMQTLLLVDGKC